jgi:hypothetical protein
VEIVVPKGVAEDSDLNRLFEEIAKRTAAKPVRDF